MAKTKYELFCAFKDFHERNPHVYSLFKRFAFEALKRGHKKLGVAIIIERIRWETSIVTNGSDFKICNDHRAYYSRMFMAEHPEHDGFFRTKSIDPNVEHWIGDMVKGMPVEDPNQLTMF